MGSAQDLAFGWEPWTAPALEDLLPQLSREEQLRVHDYLRQLQRVHKEFRTSQLSEGERDFIIIRHVRYALRHYNAKHPGEEFDAVKPLMEASASFRGQMWYHINFWARCRKTKKIKRFFAEVHYKKPFSSSVLPPPVPGAEKPPSSNSSVCSDLPPPVPGAPSSSSSVCLDLPPPVPGAPSSSSSVCSHLSPAVPGAPSFSSFFPVLIPIVEACTIIEEPLGRYRKSCAFCRGHLDILHPKGPKFVCGNDKDSGRKMLQAERNKNKGNWRMRQKAKGEEFDAVKPLMEASASFRGQMWYHINFWARCRKTKKIKRFFAEVHYKTPFSISVLPPPVPGAEKPPSSSSSSVCSDLPPPVPGAPSSSSSVCSHLSPPIPGAPSSSSSVCSHLTPPVPGAPSSCSSFFPVFIPIVEACTIIEEPLGRHRKSCAFCRGHFDILHPKGRKFVCGNDKDRVVQRIKPCGSPMGLKMPFTCHLGPDSNNGHE